LLGIVNYGMGNVKSVYNAFTLLGEESKIIEDPNDLANVDAIVLPGVGSFSDGIKNLKKMGFLDEIENQVLKNKKPYLGI
jgi:glutamine amidotransferase